MRVDRLDLIAFGPFSRMVLDLSAPGIHVIAGPNEAGKSTALHAFDQLFYGIDERSHYDFVHDRAALRLGALVRGSAGASLEFIRVKARKTPLRRVDGEPLDQSVLNTMLGGIDRSTFTSVFALGSAELRRGGEALARGGGDFKQALAAARSGGRLSDALRTIEERLGDLYKRRGQNPRINVLLAELKQAHNQVRAATLRPQEYLDRQQEVKDAEQALKKLTRELEQFRSDQSRVERLVQALPALNRRTTLLADLKTLEADGAITPPDVAVRLPLLREDLRLAESKLADTRRRLDDVVGELNELAVDDDLLAAQDSIDSLYQDRKAALEAAERLTSFSDTIKDLRDQALSTLTQVHVNATLDDIDLYTVPASVQRRIQELHDQRTAIDAALMRDRKAVDQRRRNLEAAEKRLSELTAIEDTKPLHAALNAVPQDLLTRMATADEDVRRLDSIVERLALELRIPAQQVDVMAVPTRPQIDEHVEARKDLKREGRELAKQRKVLIARLDDKRLDLATLLSGDPPPTEAELGEARTARQELWLVIRDGRHDQAGNFELAIDRADQIADRMRRDASRIADRYRLELEIGNDEKALIALSEEQAAQDDRADHLDAEWDRLWEGFPGPAPKPGAATSTLDSVERLRGNLRELADARARLSSLRKHAGLHIARLREVLRSPEEVSSLGAENALAELPELREVAEQRLAEQDELTRTHDAYKAQLVAAREELTAAEAEVTEHERSLAGWETTWQKLLEQAKLPTDRDTAAALTDLERLGQVATWMSEAARNERDSEKAVTALDRFHSLLAATASACGHAMPDDEIERHQLVGSLYREAGKNRSAADRQAVLLGDQAELSPTARALEETLKELRSELAQLCERAEVDSIDALSEAVQRSATHGRLKEALAEVKAALPADAETLMAEIPETDEDLLRARLITLTERVTDLDDQRTRQSLLLGEKKTEFARFDGSATATRAAASVATTAAALLEESEEYLRLQVARNIILSCMEGYRQAQQDPVLTRASLLFQQLTLGGYRGMELDEDGDSTIVLARRGRELLTTDRLSEGTRDQLYLALRLASLERYAEEDGALPFIVDDIFMTFDDQRTRAALGVLNEMSERFQTIVFTHHDHLAELAQTELPSGRVHVHRLPRFASATTTSG
ncbi:AAA family ATPase [Nonomuraea sp. NN258]|uniref:ATP-binding protein n=1 Tax=Nonomuraea antri TaxID=2730852 RepID=UPI0015697758|nr:YhaN family protein [Nonomuraea antri]NRQ30622.1 AAA family ATPase [Nonomuraea antri]